MSAHTIPDAELDLAIQAQALWIEDTLVSIYAAQSGISSASGKLSNPGTVYPGPAARRLRSSGSSDQAPVHRAMRERTIVPVDFKRKE